jgi:hypothetical protein
MENKVKKRVVAVCIIFVCIFAVFFWYKKNNLHFVKKEFAKESSPQANEDKNTLVPAGSNSDKKSVDQKHVVIIFDASMQNNDDSTYFEKTKDALKKIIGKIDANADVSVITHGQVFSDTTDQERYKQDICNDVNVFESKNLKTPEALQEKISNIRYKEYAPLAASFQKAYSLLSSYPKENAGIVLFGNHGEVCGGDLGEVLELVKNSGISVYIIDLGQSHIESPLLQRIAFSSNNGAYFQPESLESLSTMIDGGSINTNALQPGIQE